VEAASAVMRGFSSALLGRDAPVGGTGLDTCPVVVSSAGLPATNRPRALVALGAESPAVVDLAG
jgi:hypothetical protein